MTYSKEEFDKVIQMARDVQDEYRVVTDSGLKYFYPPAGEEWDDKKKELVEYYTEISNNFFNYACDIFPLSKKEFENELKSVKEVFFDELPTLEEFSKSDQMSNASAMIILMRIMMKKNKILFPTVKMIGFKRFFKIYGNFVTNIFNKDD